jgi:hypothetical protein
LCRSLQGFEQQISEEKGTQMVGGKHLLEAIRGNMAGPPVDAGVVDQYIDRFIFRSQGFCQSPHRGEHREIAKLQVQVWVPSRSAELL